MKIKEGFVLREVGGMYIVMPTGKNVGNFKGAVMLNESSAILFRHLQNGVVDMEGLVKALTEVYNVDGSVAQSDIERTLDSFGEAGILDR